MTLKSNKGQIQVFQEFLSFAIGVVIVISIIFLFTDVLTPTLIDEALNIQMKNVLSQVEAVSLEVISLSKQFPDKEIVMKMELPSDINDYKYDLYTRNNDFCITLSDPAYLKCKENSLGIQGYFYSGQRLLITKNNNNLTITPE